MVRLKHQVIADASLQDLASQFHYGSIKTDVSLFKPKTLFWSQFHYGSIKTCDDSGQLADVSLVSIPLWFD